MAAYGVVDYGQYLAPESPSNLFLPANGNLLQVLYAVYTFGSLFALALTYDAISYEKQTNSLALLASQPISRASLLKGKLLGRSAVYLPIASVLPVSLIAASLVLNMALTPDLQIRILLVWALTILFLLFWLALGILISSKTSKTGDSLAICIAIWIVFQPNFLGSAFSSLALHFFWPNVSFGGAFNTPSFLSTDSLFGSLFPPYRYVHALFGTLNGVSLPTTSLTYLTYGTNYVLNTATTANGWFLSAWPDFAFLAMSVLFVLAISYVLFRRSEIV